MRRQRNNSQMKEQNKTPGKELNKKETSNQPDAEFKTLLLRMLNEIMRRVEAFSENFNKKIENLKTEVET